MDVKGFYTRTSVDRHDQGQSIDDARQSEMAQRLLEVAQYRQDIVRYIERYAMKRILIALTAMTAVVSSPAFAGVETFSHVTASQSAPFTDSFALPAFNASLGTLTSVEIILTTNANGEVDVSNSTGVEQTFTNATSSVPVTVTGPAGTTINQNLVAGPVNGTVPAMFAIQVGQTLYHIPGTTTVTGIPGTATSSIFVDPANFSSYEVPPGATNLSFTVTGATGNYSGTANAGVLFGGSADVGGTTEIIYTYVADPIPEPMGMMVLGAGLVGLGIVRRRG